MINKIILQLLNELHDRQIVLLMRYVIGDEQYDIIDVAEVHAIVDTLGGIDEVEELLCEMNSAVYDSDMIRRMIDVEPFVFVDKSREMLPKRNVS